LNVLKGIFSVK